MPPPPFTACVISHTHWDREWCRAFQEFRWRLVEVMDFLLDLLENHPEYRHFYLDGQSAPDAQATLPPRRIATWRF